MSETLGNSKGRLVYIEPNDFAFFRKDKFSNGSMADNITIRPEDLKMQVDFQVILPSRDVYATDTNYDKIVYQVVTPNTPRSSLKQECRSYFQGTKIKDGEYDLTTDYINASYSEIRQGKHQDSESLGIKSITIKYNSTFYPVVVVTLVDVRGNALMAPSEYEYDQNSREARYGNTSNANESFFKSLFHFPYPRYVLTVKGFYGQSLTFTLAVTNFSTSFDSKTGDFNVTIKFIGYLYGVFGDIPFNALLVAPYVKYQESGIPFADGKQRIQRTTDKEDKQDASTRVDKMINSFWDLDRFLCTDGATHLPTFVQFMENMSTIQKRYKEKSESKEYDMTAEKNQIADANALLKYFDNFIDMPYQGISIYKIKGSSSAIYLCPSGKVGKQPEFSDAYTKLTKGINEYNKKYRSDSKQITFCDSLRTSFALRETPFKNYNSAEAYMRAVPDYEVSSGLDKTTIEHIYNKREQGKDKNYSEYPFGIYVFDSDYRKSLNDDITVAEAKITSKTKLLNKERAKINNNLLGFDPTVRNVYRDIFAHVDCFMSQFYNLLDKIKMQVKNNERLVKDCMGYTTDESSAYLSSHESLAPFPMVYRDNEGKNEMVYPGDTDNETLKNLAEVKFIDAFVDAIFDTQNRLRDAEFKNKPQTKIVQIIKNYNNTYIGGGSAFGGDAGSAYVKTDDYTRTLITDYKIGENPFKMVYDAYNKGFSNNESDNSAIFSMLSIEMCRIAQYCYVSPNYSCAQQAVEIDAKNMAKVLKGIGNKLTSNFFTTLKNQKINNGRQQKLEVMLQGAKNNGYYFPLNYLGKSITDVSNYASIPYGFTNALQTSRSAKGFFTCIDYEYTGEGKYEYYVMPRQNLYIDKYNSSLYNAFNKYFNSCAYGSNIYYKKNALTDIKEMGNIYPDCSASEYQKGLFYCGHTQEKRKVTEVFRSDTEIWGLQETVIKLGAVKKQKSPTSTSGVMEKGWEKLVTPIFEAGSGYKEASKLIACFPFNDKNFIHGFNIMGTDKPGVWYINYPLLYAVMKNIAYVYDVSNDRFLKEKPSDYDVKGTASRNNISSKKNGDIDHSHILMHTQGDSLGKTNVPYGKYISYALAPNIINTFENIFKQYGANFDGFEKEVIKRYKEMYVILKYSNMDTLCYHDWWRGLMQHFATQAYNELSEFDKG